MTHLVARLVEPLLWLLWPAPGRHRSSGVIPAREEAGRQRARIRTLWFALHGIDPGPRVIHGIEVAA